ncbi:hypothetical protein [Salipiger sp.]|uniref:hypothetical protein n=1 Tax=Salipiger sp. TaxID=2078585 RepID=UPI003A982360
MPQYHRILCAAVAAILALSGPLAADKASYLTLAERGWSYELRTTMLARDPGIPVHINGRDFSGASICLVGDPPDKSTLRTLDTFRALAREIFGKPLPMRYAGPEARQCGLGRTVVLRLYSGAPPNRALTDDLLWMNDVHDLGLPPRRRYAAPSPALAQTFFGRRGAGTHIMVQQAGTDARDPEARAFFNSILIEELFQSFTFGMDILHLDRDTAYASKLEEFPVDLRHLPWDSPAYMRGLLSSNPRGLCEFDVLMLHAVATAPVDQTNDPAFIAYIDSAFDTLMMATRRTMGDGRFAPILDPECGGGPG